MKSLYELNNVEYYHEDKRVLNIEHLELCSNQIVGFFGPNGSGKSTLFNALSFMAQPKYGTVLFNGVRSDDLAHEIKQNVVLLPQNPYLLKRTVFENIAYGLYLRKDTFNLENRVKEALSYVGLDIDFGHRKWSQLSGGEAQRVALAARLILKPKVLILDEPTSGVDTNSAQLIKEAIFLANQSWDTTLFISSHDHNWLNHTCDKRIGLFQGELLESESVNFLFSPWKKNEKGNLVKEFICGQQLVFEDSQFKKRDSIVMISAEDIVIDKKGTLENALNATIHTIFKKPFEEYISIEFLIGSISFNAKLSSQMIQEKNLLPGSQIDVQFKTQRAYWL